MFYHQRKEEYRNKKKALLLSPLNDYWCGVNLTVNTNYYIFGKFSKHPEILNQNTGRIRQFHSSCQLSLMQDYNWLHLRGESLPENRCPLVIDSIIIFFAIELQIITILALYNVKG